MLFKTPLLDKPAPGWKRDLPGPNEPPSIEPYPPILTSPPNHVDDVYLELARATMRMRGVGVWLAPFNFLLSIAFPAILIVYAVTQHRAPSLSLVLVGLCGCITALWAGMYFWKMDTEAPRDEPIRFNRARRKVYVYRFRHNGLKPFSRSAWGARAEVYDWDNLHAEACSIYGAMGSGGSTQTVTLAVLEPGTHKVVDRFHFATISSKVKCTGPWPSSLCSKARKRCPCSRVRPVTGTTKKYASTSPAALRPKCTGQRLSTWSHARRRRCTTNHS